MPSNLNFSVLIPEARALTRLSVGLPYVVQGQVPFGSGPWELRSGDVKLICPGMKIPTIVSIIQTVYKDSVNFILTPSTMAACWH